MLYSKMVHTVQARSMDIRRVTVWPSSTLTACTQNAEFVRRKEKHMLHSKKGITMYIRSVKVWPSLTFTA
jgi:hypothetical protein